MVGFIKEVEIMPIYAGILISEKEFASLSAIQLKAGENVHVSNYKVCPTRHGCSGATNCDNAYADYRR